ncbi:hypothetical protein Q9966_012635 [Columba livia]|nr:hypothetical protein Q9966_012635 [Columba livia]
MVDLRGAKVASFTVEGCELICLPQAFDLFLKHLVGGLHTVYTKLKRLEITPVVCNVEQVRILRGLGAIQPGVNRCKLISRKDFETLYNDCTNARYLLYSEFWSSSGVTGEGLFIHQYVESDVTNCNHRGELVRVTSDGEETYPEKKCPLGNASFSGYPNIELNSDRESGNGSESIGKVCLKP